MKTEYQKCMDGEFFTADSEMLQIVYRCKRLVRSLNGTDMENIYTATHTTDVAGRTNTPANKEISGCFCRTYSKPITIEDNVWIGGGAILLPGVTIGKNSVIGAGSIVTRSIPENCVAVGNPCRVIKHIDSN